MTEMVTADFGTGSRLCQSSRRYIADHSLAVDTERAFADLWERSLELRPEVIGREGEVYEVLFPGVRNQGAGPDFKGALLRRDGSTIGGDVELHLDSSGWRAHGHQGDSRYRGVVLQVVLRASRHSADVQMPPTAEARFELEVESQPNESHPLGEPDLERLGVRRFLAKSAGFRLEFETSPSPEQPVYASLLDAMGYARNRKPFRTLARLVPYDVFPSLSGEPRSTAEFAVFAALVVGGGLKTELEGFERKQVRQIARAMGVRGCVSTRAWSRFRVRPSNSPVSRIKGIAPLIARSVNGGLVKALEAEFESNGVRGLIREVEQRPYIGRGTAVTVVANVILPALHAVSSHRAAGETERLEKAFKEMPAPPQDAVTRGISSVVGLRFRPKLASQHFGLHALARSRSWPGTGASTA